MSSDRVKNAMLLEYLEQFNNCMEPPLLPIRLALQLSQDMEAARELRYPAEDVLKWFIIDALKINPKDVEMTPEVKAAYSIAHRKVHKAINHNVECYVIDGKFPHKVYRG